MVNLRILGMLTVFTIAAFLPAFALSDEMKAMMEEVKPKIVTSAPILTTTVAPVHPSGNLKIKLGTEKAAVTKLIGRPPSILYSGSRSLYDYGKQMVLFENDRVINWDGFDKNDPRFENSEKPSSPINFKTSTVDYAGNSSHTSTANHSYSQTTIPRHSNGNDTTQPTRTRLPNGGYTTQVGPRGGVYHISIYGKKVYQKKNDQ